MLEAGRAKLVLSPYEASIVGTVLERLHYPLETMLECGKRPAKSC